MLIAAVIASTNRPLAMARTTSCTDSPKLSTAPITGPSALDSSGNAVVSDSAVATTFAKFWAILTGTSTRPEPANGRPRTIMMGVVINVPESVMKASAMRPDFNSPTAFSIPAGRLSGLLGVRY